MKTKNSKVEMLSLSKSARMRRRGASMVEYALLLVAVLVLGAAAFKHLGEKIGQSAATTTEQF